MDCNNSVYKKLICGPSKSPGGGALPLLKVVGTCRWTGYDFHGHQYWHRVSKSAQLATGGLLRLSQGYFSGLPSRVPQPTMSMTGSRSRHQRRVGVCGTWARVNMTSTRSQSRHQQRCVRDARRDATDFEIFISFYCNTTIRHVYPMGAILQQGMQMKVFGKEYCDRVYFLCAERFVTGSGFEPQRHPLTQFRGECPPPPPTRRKSVQVLI